MQIYFYFLHTFTHVYQIPHLPSDLPESQKPCQPEAHPYSFLPSLGSASLAPHSLINHHHITKIHIILTFI